MKPAKVTSTYPDGTTETVECPPDDYVIVLGPQCYISHAQKYANGTVILTIKLDRAAA